MEIIEAVLALVGAVALAGFMFIWLKPARTPDPETRLRDQYLNDKKF